MDIQTILTSAIKKAGKKQADLPETEIVGSPQAANRKMKMSTWTLKELLTVCDWLGCKLFFETQTGEKIQITEE